MPSAAADRKGFARQLGRAIKRPSSTSDIKGDPEADSKPPSFPPAYEDPSVPPAFVRASRQVGHLSIDLRLGPCIQSPGVLDSRKVLIRTAM